MVISLAAAISVGGNARGADGPSSVTSTFKQYCFQCHGQVAMGGLNLEQLNSQPSMGGNFRQWEKVAAAIEQKRMPPAKVAHPSDAERSQAVKWIRTELRAFAAKHDGDPGRVTVRRLTSGEYAYTIEDLTGLDLEVGIDSTSDSVGGEGFTSFGDVQFMQDATVERYLDAAKRVANHAVIGSGPLEFFSDPGKTGFELSAITRIKDIYGTHGLRTVSGEGGRPYGLEKYGKAFFVAWNYRHRAALGQSKANLKDLAAGEGIAPRFAQHIWNVLHKPDLGYPLSAVVDRWRKLPAPGSHIKAASAAARAGCDDLQKFLVTWPSWLFARGDLAAGGAGDESPLEFNDRSLKVEATHHFTFNILSGGRGASAPKGPAKIYLNVAPVNPTSNANRVVLWRNPTIALRHAPPVRPAAPAVQKPPAVAQPTGGRRFPPAGPRRPLKEVVSGETAKQLNFGQSPDGSPLGPGDFASGTSASFEVPFPEGAFGLEFQADAQLGRDRDQVFRILISDREDGGSRGVPTRTLLGDPQSAGYRTFKAGVMELATLLPPNSHGEPTPADKDPVPEPFDNTYNVPEHDEFVVKVKYLRDDSFVRNYMLDEPTRIRLDQAWNDLYASFEYHDSYFHLVAKHFGVDLKEKHIGEMDKGQIDALPAEVRKYGHALRSEYFEVQAAQAAARPRHVEDCLRFATRAWRRPLSESEKVSLRSFYTTALASEGDHRKAIRALLARILVAPAFLYRIEQAANVSPANPLTNWEMASRLSYFLWSSIPDAELRRAAAAGELTSTVPLQRQVKRMLADPKARRLSTEFFGQWLGFYHFDEHRGVDTSRFPEFTDEVKKAMYDEAVSFFEHVIRKDRPVREMLFADYAFLNRALAKHYGVKKEIKSTGAVERVEGANEFQRGGLLRLGAMLTATSAPLRTSPVKRGDWLLRRVLGTPVPPPPADAGSIPADDQLFGGLSVRQRLEAHKRNATCANCHTRIDPLGFPLERYDSIGRIREKYADGKPIEDVGALADQTPISGIDGLLKYLRSQERQVVRTLSSRLVGYALGRTIQASDQPLIDRMAALGGNAAFSQLAAAIVTSRQFRNRLGREEEPPAATAKTVALKTMQNSEKAGGR
ncbi:MAG TPA: DUF1592 domain-containing protein [Bryobacteraceae bacterium]|nr:DUF1592 domain-containing protein [Bryobacteraceae bacterium]